MRVRHGECCVEIEFKACFRDFLRYSRYSSCGRDKLSKTGEFYLRGCKVAALRFLRVGICRIARVVLNSARHSALWSRYAHHPAFAVRCRYRYRVRRVCITVLALRQSVRSFACRTRRRRLKFYVRRPAHCSTLSLDIRVFRALRLRSSLEAWLLRSRMRRSASFTKRASRSVRCVPLNFKI